MLCAWGGIPRYRGLWPGLLGRGGAVRSPVHPSREATAARWGHQHDSTKNSDYTPGPTRTQWGCTQHGRRVSTSAASRPRTSFSQLAQASLAAMRSAYSEPGSAYGSRIEGYASTYGNNTPWGWSSLSISIAALASACRQGPHMHDGQTSTDREGGLIIAHMSRYGNNH